MPIRLQSSNAARRPGYLAPLVAVCLVTLLFAATTLAQNPRSLRPQGYVNDFAHVLAPDSKNAIEALCQEVDHKAQAQIAVVTVRSLEGESIEDYSINLAAHWGIGPKQKDRGVLILLAPNEHKYRIEVGYGLEPILPDGLVGSFGREAQPQLRIQNYSGAVLLLTERIAAVIAKDRGVKLEALAQESQNNPMGAETPPPPFTARNIAVPLLSIMMLLFFPLLGLLMRMRAGRKYGRRGHGVWWAAGTPWYFGGGNWGGGSWGGGAFGGGGGFGGFGGGSFGGGGASGSW